MKRLATARSVEVFQPERLRDPATLDRIRAWRPDVAVVAAYGRLLPGALIDLPSMGTVNVHASLLPRWRGAAPIQRAIMAGDRETGVTIMRVVLALDAGPMLAAEPTPIGPDETSVELETRLADLGARLLVRVVDALGTDEAPEERAQDDRLVTHAERIDRRDSHMDWTRPATALHDQIRALQPWPHAAALLAGRRVAVLRARVEPGTATGVAPGTVVAAGRDGLLVAAGLGMLRVLDVQPEGRPPMDVGAFLNGTRVVSGDRFGPLPAGP